MVCPLNNFLERLIFSWKEGSHKFGSRAAGCFKVALTEKEKAITQGSWHVLLVL